MLNVLIPVFHLKTWAKIYMLGNDDVPCCRTLLINVIAINHDSHSRLILLWVSTRKWRVFRMGTTMSSLRFGRPDSSESPCPLRWSKITPIYAPRNGKFEMKIGSWILALLCISVFVGVFTAPLCMYRQRCDKREWRIEHWSNISQLAKIFVSFVRVP